MQIPTLQNKKLFELAFTHRSYLNEAKEKLESNERLEFLGDSILSFIVSDYLFTKYPHYNEGILTNIRSLVVNTKSLAQSAETLNFGEYLKLSKGEEESKGRQNQSLLADCFESYVGALFLDRGVDAVKHFILDILVPKIDDLVSKQAFKDPKSLLQEYVQAQKQTSPLYKVVNEKGPAHARIFTVGVFIGDKQTGLGVGKSKQQAEESAAEAALLEIKAKE